VSHYDSELTLTKVLSDPLIQTIMAADGVEPRALAAMLSHVARQLAHRPTPPCDEGACA
jgi:hypothetical protein